MQRVVYKYPIPLEETFEIRMPEVSTPLSVQLQAGTPMLLVLVDPESMVIPKRFRIAGTGRPFDAPVPTARDMAPTYIGTFQMGDYVWHLFRD